MTRRISLPTVLAPVVAVAVVWNLLVMPAVYDWLI